MEILYFVRESEGLDHYLYHADCFFIPKENILFVRERCGDDQFYEIIKKDYILEETRSLIGGVDPYENKRGPNVIGIPDFSNIKRFEYNDEKIREILRDIRNRDNLLEKVESGIEELLKKV